MSRLKELRREFGLSKSDVAAYLKISRWQYSHYEIRVKWMPARPLIKLADLYQTSVDYILGLTDERYLNCK